MENNQLQHHGILGMHWGVRRYQPYRTGERVKGGKEVGKATKVKQRSGSKTESIKRIVRKGQEISDKITIANGKYNITTSRKSPTSTYDNAIKPDYSGNKKTRTQADLQAKIGINGNYADDYNRGKRIREAEAREQQRKSENKNNKKKLLAIGSAATAATLLTIGGLKMSSVSKNPKMSITLGKNTVENLMNPLSNVNIDNIPAEYFKLLASRGLIK